MAVTMHQSSPVAHVPLGLGVVRQLHISTLIDTFCPPHPAHVLSCGRGVEALLLARLDGHHALSKVGARLEARGMFSVRQPGLTRPALQEDRLGQRRAGLFAVHRHRVFGAIARHALEVYAVPPPGLQQETTTSPRYGAYEEETRPVQGLVPPCPAYGHRKDGRDDLTQVLWRLGGSREGLPLRLGVRDGQTRDSPEMPVAMEEGLALGLEGVRGMVADSQASCKRTRGLCLEQPARMAALAMLTVVG